MPAVRLRRSFRSGRQRRTEAVIVIGRIRDPGTVLMPELIAGARKPARRSVDHVDCACATDPADAFTPRTDREVRFATLSEVSPRQRISELVQNFRRAENAAALSFMTALRIFRRVIMKSQSLTKLRIATDCATTSV